MLRVKYAPHLYTQNKVSKTNSWEREDSNLRRVSPPDLQSGAIATTRLSPLFKGRIATSFVEIKNKPIYEKNEKNEIEKKCGYGGGFEPPMGLTPYRPRLPFGEPRAAQLTTLPPVLVKKGTIVSLKTLRWFLH